MNKSFPKPNKSSLMNPAEAANKNDPDLIATVQKLQPWPFRQDFLESISYSGRVLIGDNPDKPIILPQLSFSEKMVLNGCYFQNVHFERCSWAMNAMVENCVFVNCVFVNCAISPSIIMTNNIFLCCSIETKNFIHLKEPIGFGNNFFYHMKIYRGSCKFTMDISSNIIINPRIKAIFEDSLAKLGWPTPAEEEILESMDPAQYADYIGCVLYRAATNVPEPMAHDGFFQRFTEGVKRKLDQGSLLEEISDE